LLSTGGLHPGQSTNGTAALIAEKVHAEQFLNATDVDGVYDRDPNKFKKAKKFKTRFLNNYFEDRIISVPTLPPFMAFSIIFGSAFMILVLILERSIIFRATMSIKS